LRERSARPRHCAVASIAVHGLELIPWSRPYEVGGGRHARRVPKFVIEATGLDTKKKIVAKFGENAAFVKGKPLPKAVKAA
jgi:hypothetical protein